MFWMWTAKQVDYKRLVRFPHKVTGIATSPQLLMMPSKGKGHPVQRLTIPCWEARNKYLWPVWIVVLSTGQYEETQRIETVKFEARTSVKLKTTIFCYRSGGWCNPDGIIPYCQHFKMTHINIPNTSRLTLTHSVEPQPLAVKVIKLKLLIVVNLEKVVSPVNSLPCG